MSNRSILDADMPTLALWIGQGWRWWLGEMAEMVPPVMRGWATGRRKLADYQPDTGEILLRHDVQTGYPVKHGAVAVILPPDFCLTRRLERPAMSQRDLDSMVALECDRIMPMAADRAVLGSRIVARDGANIRMQCEVAAIPVAAAQNLGAALARLPRPCLAVYHETPVAGAALPIDLLPALRRAGLVGGNGSMAGRLWLVVAFLFALNMGLLVWRDMASVDRLADMVAQQKPAVDAARRIEARITQYDRLASVTQGQRHDAEPLAMLGVMTAALPPGVWLQRFGWQGDDLRIAGYRPAQADVTAGLRRAGFSVTRYSESAATGTTKLGQPFEATLRLRKTP